MGTNQQTPFTFLLLLEKSAWVAPQLSLHPAVGGVWHSLGWLSQAPRSVGQPCGCVYQAKQDFVTQSYGQQRDVAVTQHKETRKTFSKHLPLFLGHCHSGTSIGEGFSIWFTESHKLLRIHCSQLKHLQTLESFKTCPECVLRAKPQVYNY